MCVSVHKPLCTSVLAHEMCCENDRAFLVLIKALPVQMLSLIFIHVAVGFWKQFGKYLYALLNIHEWSKTCGGQWFLYCWSQIMVCAAIACDLQRPQLSWGAGSALLPPWKRWEILMIGSKWEDSCFNVKGKLFIYLKDLWIYRSAFHNSGCSDEHWQQRPQVCSVTLSRMLSSVRL